MIYLASPYSNPDPTVVEYRYRRNLAVTAELLAKGKIVYSPIVHNHWIAQTFSLNGDWQTWMNHDLAMLELAAELYVLRLPGWTCSKGLNAEVAHALARSISITYINP